MKRYRGTVACGLAFAAASVVLSFAVRSAEAQPATAPSPADIANARAIFDAGGRAYDSGDYLAALQAFEQAYAIAQRDNIVFSIAQAHRQRFIITGEQEHLTQAIASYKQFLAGGKAGSRRAEATKALGDLEAIAATRGQSGAPTQPTPAPVLQKTILAIDSPTPGALISIDGSEPAPPQVNAEVTDGAHRIKITAPGFVDKEVTVHAKAREFTPETFELEEKPARVAVEAPSGSEVSIDGQFVGKVPLSRELDVRPGRRFVSVTLNGHASKGEVVSLDRGEERRLAFRLSTTTQRDASFGFFAASGASFIVMGVLAGVSVARENKAEDILKQQQAGTITEAQREDYIRAGNDRDNFRNAAIVAGAGGGVIGLIGVGLFAFDRPSPLQSPTEVGPTGPKKDKPIEGPPKVEMQLQPWFGIDGGGLGASGRF